MALGAAVLLTGCAAAGSSAGAASSSPAPGRPAPPSSSAAGQSSCGEPEPDRGPVDLRGVRLTSAPGGLTAAFRLGASPTAVPGVLQLTVGIWNREGAAERSLDVRWADGVPDVRIYDVGDAVDRALPVRPEVAGRTVTVHFPASATAGLGRSWRWEAFASVDGTDVDDCPNS